MSAKTEYPHIVMDEKGVPVIDGTSMKIVELVSVRTAYGWSPEELHFQHPYLSLSQIHAALAYYWDHQADLDQNIARRLQEMESLRHQQIGVSRLKARLSGQEML